MGNPVYFIVHGNEEGGQEAIKLSYQICQGWLNGWIKKLSDSVEIQNGSPRNGSAHPLETKKQSRVSAWLFWRVDSCDQVLPFGSVQDREGGKHWQGACRLKMGPRWKPHPDTKTGSGSPTAKQCREDTDNGKQTTGAEGATKKNNCRSFHSTFQN